MSASETSSYAEDSTAEPRSVNPFDLDAVAAVEGEDESPGAAACNTSELAADAEPLFFTEPFDGNDDTETEDEPDVNAYDLADPEEFASYLTMSSFGLCPECGAELEIDVRLSGTIVVSCRWPHPGTGSLARHAAALKRKWLRKLPKSSVPLVIKPVFVIGRGAAHIAIANDALRAVVEIDKASPTMFLSGGSLVGVSETGEAFELNEQQLLSRLAEAALWVDEGDVPIDPPSKLARHLLKLREYGQIVPELERVVTTPLMQTDGRLLTQAGYDADSKTLLVPAFDISECVPPKHVTEADVAEARSLIVDELIGDFPFKSEADRAHAVGMLLLPFVRDTIDGPTPMHFFTAPTAGTGKGKLVDTLLAPGCGTVASAAFSGSEEEQRKAITTALRSAPVAVKWDNVRGTVKSQALELALTESVYKDRILRGSTEFSGRVRCIWSMTSNNGQLGTDMARRVIAIRLDSKTDRPQSRKGPREGSNWQHVLPNWSLDNRASLVRAALVLCRNWIQQGSPSGYEGRRGSYEEWERVIGGILMSANIPGFLANVDEITGEDPERSSLEELFSGWQERYGDCPMTAEDLAADDWLSRFAKNPQAPLTASSVGFILRTHKDQRVGSLVLKLTTNRGGVKNTWRVYDDSAEETFSA